MQITVHLTHEVAESFRKLGTDCPAAKSLRAQLVKVKASINPLHESTDDPELFKHFYLVVKNKAEAGHIIEELMQQPGVKAAYVKPPEGPPS